MKRVVTVCLLVAVAFVATVHAEIAPKSREQLQSGSTDIAILKRTGWWSLLMAQQLVQAGVNLVQVNLGNNEAWDTHDYNFPLLRDCLLPPTDRGISALLDDLQSLGMLEETLVVMVREMGLTPNSKVRSIPLCCLQRLGTRHQLGSAW